MQRSQRGFDLLRDLQDSWLLVGESLISVGVLEQATRTSRHNDPFGALQWIRFQNECQRPSS